MLSKKRLLAAGIIAVIVTILTIVSIQKDKAEPQTNNNTEEKLTGQIMIYFPNQETEELTPEYRYVSMEDIKTDMIGTILKEIIKGPNNNELKKISGKEIHITKYQEIDNKIIVNLKTEETQTEIIKKAIEKSLTEIKEIEEVEIIISET